MLQIRLREGGTLCSGMPGTHCSGMGGTVYSRINGTVCSRKLITHEKSDQLIGIRIPKSVKDRLDVLARKTGRTRTFYIRQALLEHLDDLEDMYMAKQVLFRIDKGKEEIYSLDEVAHDLELDD